jgi:UDP-3-O-[3-hydroxymyristoyl] glucosamine N-acyltransferase
MFNITAKEIISKFGGVVRGDQEKFATHPSSIEDAAKESFCFVSDKKYYSHIPCTKASIIIARAGENIPESSASIIFVDDPNIVFARILELYEKESKEILSGIHPTAIVSTEAVLEKNIYIGPYSIIEAGVKICENTIIMSGCFIGKNTFIGSSCLVYPNVVIREKIYIGNKVIIHSGVVIGSDGFGFAFDKKSLAHFKVPQVGGVSIEDNVEIGANTTIDRATIGNTKIGKGTKIDNLVQIAHNVEIGENCIICAQVGIAGSTTIGNYVTLAGQAGITGHIKIEDKATVAAQGGVTKNVKKNEIVSGYPAMPHKQALENTAMLNKLPDIYKRLKELEKKLNR